MITLAPDAPRWATAGERGGNYKVSSTEFARFARAVGTALLGRLRGPAGGARVVDLERAEPHLLHQAALGGTARLPADRREGRARPDARPRPPGSKIFVGELAPVGTATKVIGPLRFLRAWLCLDNNYTQLRGSVARKAGLRRASSASAPPASRTTRTARSDCRRPSATSSTSRRSSGSPRRSTSRHAPAGSPSGCRSTTRSSASRPIRRTRSCRRRRPRAAQIVNEKEEFSYRYSRLKSYSQYLLYDDPPRSGSAALRWAGFQTGLRLPERSPEALLRRLQVPDRGAAARAAASTSGAACGPGKGIRYVQLERRSGGSWVKDGPEIATSFSGYFKVNRSRRATYRFHYVTGIGGSRARHQPRGLADQVGDHAATGLHSAGPDRAARHRRRSRRLRRRPAATSGRCSRTTRR